MNTLFENEYKRCSGAMYRAARAVAGKEIATQAVSEAVLKLWSFAEYIDYLSPDRVMGLFCTTARWAAIDAIRHRDFILSDDKTWAELNPPIAMSRSQASVERTIAVHRALAKLAPLEAHIAWNFFAVEFSAKEILEDMAKDGKVWTLDQFYYFLNKQVKPKLRAALIAVGADKL